MHSVKYGVIVWFTGSVNFDFLLSVSASGAVALGWIKPYWAKELCKCSCWFDVCNCWSLWRMGFEKSGSCSCCWGCLVFPIQHFEELNILLQWLLSVLYVLQIVRREGLSLWQELLPSIITLSNMGPIQVHCNCLELCFCSVCMVCLSYALCIITPAHTNTRAYMCRH